MSYPHASRTAATSHHPLDDSADLLDAFLIDSDFDDSRDQYCLIAEATRA